MGDQNTMLELLDMFDRVEADAIWAQRDALREFKDSPEGRRVWADMDYADFAAQLAAERAARLLVELRLHRLAKRAKSAGLGLRSVQVQPDYISASVWALGVSNTAIHIGWPTIDEFEKAVEDLISGRAGA